MSSSLFLFNNYLGPSFSFLYSNYHSVKIKFFCIHSSFHSFCFFSISLLSLFSFIFSFFPPFFYIYIFVFFLFIHFVFSFFPPCFYIYIFLISFFSLCYFFFPSCFKIFLYLFFHSSCFFFPFSFYTFVFLYFPSSCFFFLSYSYIFFCSSFSSVILFIFLSFSFLYFFCSSFSSFLLLFFISRFFPSIKSLLIISYFPAFKISTSSLLFVYLPFFVFLIFLSPSFLSFFHCSLRFLFFTQSVMRIKPFSAFIARSRLTGNIRVFSLPLFLSVYLSIYPFLYLSRSIYLFLSLSLSLSLSISISPLSLSPSLSASTYRQNYGQSFVQPKWSRVYAWSTLLDITAYSFCSSSLVEPVCLFVCSMHTEHYDSDLKLSSIYLSIYLSIYP
ncbi:unnamed protein product [Acanthosepion pharaonis]|uniref:Uncharacterized protein n=1 Tax=Acanthosepion pharaonis TaxID=158019 RepID=A0A812CCK8_ACAPH|nr:unnamed protein product [Sepia pharaonis]